jgi:hypothetical protein
MNNVDADAGAAVSAEPESVERVHAVRRVAEELWDAYTRDGVEDPRGHLCCSRSVCQSSGR